MQKLTERQRKILQIIADSVENNGYPPTYQQLCKTLNIHSKNGVKKHIDALVRKGYLEKDSSARGIRIVAEDYRPKLQSDSNLPLLGRVAAGTPVFAEENIERYIPVPRHLIKTEGRYFALKVLGDSMINAGIFENDLVLVRAINTAVNNEIVVALVNGEITVKRLIREGEQVYLKAENPAYADIHPQESWSIQGKVIGLIREYFN